MIAWLNNGRLRAARGGRGFTLIELLVVVAVLGILASLLLPAIGRSKSAAHRIKCVSQLHQLGLAAQMYWDDHDGAAFRYLVGPTNLDGMSGKTYWFGWIQDEGAGEGHRAFEPGLGALYPYLQGRTVEICPALDYLSPVFKLKATGASYGYGYNRHLSPLAGPPLKIAQVTRPSEIVVLADAAQVNVFQAPASPEKPMIEEFYYVSANPAEATAHFRHHQTANVALCDGHVECERPDPGSIDQRLPQMFVGRLRPEILRVP